jgi:cell division protein FtsA
VARDPYLVAIDFGSHSIKLAVAKDSLDENFKVQILALVEKSSSGIKRGIVTNMTEATESLIEIINQAESIIGLPIKRSVIGLSGMGVSFTSSDGLIIISRNDNEILESDVDRVIQDSLTKAFGIHNHEIIHIVPKNFSVDNQGGIKNPVGMIGSKLEAKTLIVSVETSYLRNFTKVFNQADIDIQNEVFTPLASADFLLSVRQKKAGTVLVDIGYSSTSYIVWENDEILASGQIPIGSDHITGDLAVGLQTTIEMAEEIKKQHLDLRDDADNEINEVEMFNPDIQTNEIFKIDEIRLYARARVEELFLLLNKELKKLGKNGQLPGGVVMVGGGSALVGIDDVAKHVMRLPIFKYAFDKNEIDFVPDYNNDPSFINAISLAAYSLHHLDEMNYSKPNKKSNDRRSQSSSDGSSGIGGMLKNLWPWS